MREQIKKMSKEAGIDEITFRALFIGATEYYRGQRLVADQREDLLKGKILEWLERADDEDDPAWLDPSDN